MMTYDELKQFQDYINKLNSLAEKYFLTALKINPGQFNQLNVKINKANCEFTYYDIEDNFVIFECYETWAYGGFDSHFLKVKFDELENFSLFKERQLKSKNKNL